MIQSKYKIYIKIFIRDYFYDFLIFLNKFKLFNLIHKQIFQIYLLNEGYCSNWGYLIKKSSNNIFIGEKFFLKKFKKINIADCIDIGANIGEYSANILKLNNNTSVIAFEPSPECYKKLIMLKNIFNNRFKFHKCALSNKNTSGFLYYGKKKTGLASLDRKINKIPYVGESNKNRIKVKIKKLDNFIKDKNIGNIDFIKIDVEGHEMNVIEGASKFIKKKNIKLIQIEFNWHHLIKEKTVYNFSKKLNNYLPTRLNLLNGKLKIINPLDFASNFFLLNNLVFIQKQYFKKYKEILLS